ncbi:hypothetical protein [Lactobacillus sp. ESL0225]|uniref:hypothetical protein n=1 Tax=Lactobacillus sp. ESL0225 TaxID=2069351 RepID=UPI000EFBAA98|nr:hypothetical protein [Lactobacillus sp. ESL0225]RMC51315.1 hypothetical protein F5ESL0225_02910 [Lactobacillus sp. ESL0225]
MKKTVKDVEKLDKGLIEASLQSTNISKVAKVLTDKLNDAQSPEDMTLSEFEELYALADMIRVYAINQCATIENSEMLIDFEVKQHE